MKRFTVLCVATVCALAGGASADIGFVSGQDLRDGGQATHFGSIFGQVGTRGGTGDSFVARALLQAPPNAYFIDDVPHSHTFGGSEFAGNNLITGQPFTITSAKTSLGGNLYLIQVEMGTQGPWQPTPGLTAPNGNVFQSWRLDVGMLAAGTDAIDFANPITVMSSGFSIFNSVGGSLGTFALTLNGSTASSVAGVGVVGLGGGDIGGFDLARIQLFWTVEIIPAPGTASLIGLGGLVAMRRRR